MKKIGFTLAAMMVVFIGSASVFGGSSCRIAYERAYSDCAREDGVFSRRLCYADAQARYRLCRATGDVGYLKP